MNHCTKCDANVNPVHEMQLSGRVLPCCPNCSSVISSAAPAPASSAATGLTLVSSSVGPNASPSAPGGNADIISLARTRLEAIEVRVAALTQLKQEASALRAMIAAFDAALLEEPS